MCMSEVKASKIFSPIVLSMLPSKQFPTAIQSLDGVTGRSVTLTGKRKNQDERWRQKEST